MNARVYLSAGDPVNLTSLRILSSLGIQVCATIAGGVDWEALADLAAYALLGRVPRGGIEPFALIASSSAGGATVDWGRLIFDDPDRFLHVDAKGRVALSGRELAEAQFIAGRVEEIGSPKENPAMRERRHARRRCFTDDHTCAVCPGWQICLGRFASEAAGGGCAAFFEELLDLASHHRAMNEPAEERAVWQP